MSWRSRYTRLAVWLSGMLLAAAACGGGGSGNGYNLTGASAASSATHAKAATTQPHTAGSHCDHQADARR